MKRWIALLLCVLVQGQAWAATQGPRNPTTGADDASFGTVAWTNPGNILASDDVQASALCSSCQSHYLKATGFGFTIPGGATISGITVEIEKANGGVGGPTNDTRVRIVKGGAIGATDKSEGPNWPTNDAYSTYGSGSDLWGETWTSTDINSATFGVVIAHIIGLVGPPTPTVDHIRITVTYSGGGGAGGGMGGGRISTRGRVTSSGSDKGIIE